MAEAARRVMERGVGSCDELPTRVTASEACNGVSRHETNATTTHLRDRQHPDAEANESSPRGASLAPAELRHAQSESVIGLQVTPACEVFHTPPPAAPGPGHRDRRHQAAVGGGPRFVQREARDHARERIGGRGWHYPALQLPQVTPREFSGMVAGGGDYGTSLIGQWREPFGTNQLSFDAGFISPGGGAKNLFTLGGALGFPLLRASVETPIDVALTGGGYLTFGDGSALRLPFGAVVGHRIAMQGSSLAITPFAHPRASIDFCVSQCGEGEGKVGTKVVVNFDAGVDFQFTPQLSARGGLTYGGISEGESQVGFGVALAYRPAILAGGTTGRR